MRDIRNTKVLSVYTWWILQTDKKKVVVDLFLKFSAHLSEGITSEKVPYVHKVNLTNYCKSASCKNWLACFFPHKFLMGFFPDAIVCLKLRFSQKIYINIFLIWSAIYKFIEYIFHLQCNNLKTPKKVNQPLTTGITSIRSGKCN